MAYKTDTLDGAIERIWIESSAHAAVVTNPEPYVRMMSAASSDSVVREMLKELKLTAKHVRYDPVKHQAWAAYRLLGTRRDNLTAEDWLQHIAARYEWLFKSFLREAGVLPPSDYKRPVMKSEYSGLLGLDFIDPPDVRKLLDGHVRGVGEVGALAERSTVSRREREAILRTTNGTCYKCQKPKTVDEVEAHHIQPLEYSRVEYRVFVPLCKQCHKAVYRLNVVDQMRVFHEAWVEILFTGGALDVTKESGENDAGYLIEQPRGTHDLVLTAAVAEPMLW